MVEKIAHKMRDREEGFTLIELMVVVLIIGILIAIALPTFLGARQRAQDRAAQSNLRNGLVAAKTFFTDQDVYTGFNAAQGTLIEPSLAWVDGGAAAAKKVTIHVINANDLVLDTVSDSGNIFCMEDNATGPGTTFGKLDATTAGSCTGGW